MDFDEWGRLKVLNLGAVDMIPFGFAGGLLDFETTLVPLVQMGARARWYDPMTGRFITKDPVLFLGGYNVYAYAANDPVNLIDPDGTWPLPIDTLPIRPWMFFPIPGRAEHAEHMNRNLHNKCPKHISQLRYECDGTWSKSWSGSKQVAEPQRIRVRLRRRRESPA
jgi:RHS repeat-associated protein